MSVSTGGNIFGGYWRFVQWNTIWFEGSGEKGAGLLKWEREITEDTYETDTAGGKVWGLLVRLRWDDCGFDAAALRGVEESARGTQLRIWRGPFLFAGRDADGPDRRAAE